MSLNGVVNDADWTVTCNTTQTAEGVECWIGVEQRNVEGGRFVHRFQHAHTCASEREAMLSGLREGMAWIHLRAAKTIDV